MPETHLTNGKDASETVTTVTPKRDRAEYMRHYRARKATNNPSPEFQDEIKPNPEIANSEIKPEESELNKLNEEISAEQYQQKVREADAATAALKQRIAEADQAAELNRQVQAARMAQQRPPTRDELLEHWKAQGLSDANAAFLKANPDLIDGHELTILASNQATQEGHVLDTPEHREATKVIFHKWMAEAHQTAAAKINEPPPKFFEPTPAPSASRQQPSKSSHYSAPVSRELPGDYRAPDPRQVRLTAAEAEAAKISGISAAEYARQKLKYEQMKARGEVEG